MMKALLCLSIPAAALLCSSLSPALAQSAATAKQRLERLERQYAETLSQLQENGRRARQLEAELRRLKDEHNRLLQGSQRRIAVAAAAPQIAHTASNFGSKPVKTAWARPALATSAGASIESDAAEVAYGQGYKLWRAGNYRQALTTLSAVASSFPTHRRASWARNLTGRALLDKGEPRSAAQVLLANYRANPGGERAADSLYYLGQALVRMGHPKEACTAYTELELVYGPKMRDELRTLLPRAKAQACG